MFKRSWNLQKKTLIFIPVLFILLRVWATIQYFYTVYLTNIALVVEDGYCIPSHLKGPHVVLGIFQVCWHASWKLGNDFRFNIVCRLLEVVGKDGLTVFSMCLCHLPYVTACLIISKGFTTAFYIIATNPHQMNRFHHFSYHLMNQLLLTLWPRIWKRSGLVNLYYVMNVRMYYNCFMLLSSLCNIILCIKLQHASLIRVLP